MPIRPTERSLYNYLLDVFREVAGRYGVKVSGGQELSVEGKLFPDAIIELDGHRIYVQVKVVGESATAESLLEDISKSYPVAKKYGADLVGLLFPREVRDIPFESLEAVVPRLKVSRALVLTEWMGRDLRDLELEQLVETIIGAFAEYKRSRIPSVDYLTVAAVARDAIEEIAGALRGYMGAKYKDVAQAIVGRYDFYKSLLEDFVEDEEIMKTYIADIVAYLLVIQLLFAHVVSVKRHGADVLPKIDDPLSPPDSLIDDIEANVEKLRLQESYESVLGSLPHVLGLVKDLSSLNRAALVSLGRYVYAIEALRPEHVREDLLGRIYQEGLPPETRKNLGAFFTHPAAAKLLAELAIERWDSGVLDPACGSGTLLAASYWAKERRARGLPGGRGELHRLFVEQHIVGVDVMQFARELTAINLALQDVDVEASPRVYFGDGIKKMVNCVKSGPPAPRSDPPTLLDYIKDYVKAREGEYESLGLPCEGFDVVIMNPPFTRRERIPEEERGKLDELLGEVVQGKTGYWAYFFAAADNVLRPGGRLAAVTPEEFFVGSSAESLRRHLFLQRGYRIKYVVRSAAEVAFSEGAKYRDYLVVLEKPEEAPGAGAGRDSAVFVILRKKKDELGDEDVLRVVELARALERDSSRLGASEPGLADVVRVDNVSEFVEKHVSNLKPLVGFSCPDAQRAFLELVSATSAHPTLGDVAEVFVYKPGQHKAVADRIGAEDYARRLFIARYGARGKVTFRLRRDEVGKVLVEVGGKALTIDKRYLRPSLRTPSGVRHLDVTGEHEYVIVDANALGPDDWRAAGLADGQKLAAALEDVSSGYRDKAANVVVVRRAQLTSPGMYWLAFYSDDPILFTTSPFFGLRLKEEVAERVQAGAWLKALAVYLNSTVALLQLLGYLAETRGSWVTLHAETVWGNIAVPDPAQVSPSDLGRALSAFKSVSKQDVGSLYERISSGDPAQRAVDEAALGLLGLHGWASRLNEIYGAVKCELDALERILEESRRSDSPKKGGRKKGETRQRKSAEGSVGRAAATLDRWMGRAG